MLSGDPTLQIPSEIVYGFANCGHTFYSTFNSVFTLKGRLLRADLKYPSHLVMEGNGGQVWIRTPKSRREQMYHFLFHLRQTMRWLALNPFGQKTITSEKEIARMLVSLPRRAAFVRSGDDIGVIYTEDSLPDCDEEFVEARTTQIKVQTIQKYC